MATSNRIETIFTAQDRATAVMRQIGTAGDRLQGTFERLSAPLLKAQTLWASLATGAAVSAITNLVGAIDDLDEAAQGLGTTAVQLAAIRQAGTEAGVGAEKLDTALTRLNVNISEAANGNPKAAATFRAFGNAALDAAVKAGDSGRVLRELANEFSRLGDGPAKTALAIDLFGKAGAALIPLLNGGSQALDRFTGLTDETVKATVRLQTEIDKLGSAWDRFKYKTASVAVPALNNLLDAIDRIKETDFQAALLASGSPSAAVARGVIELTRAYNSAGKAADLRNRAIEEGAKLSGAEAVEANRGAQAIRDRAAADEAAATAATKKAKAIRDSSNAYKQEFDDVARIRRNRSSAEEDIRRDEEDAVRRRSDRADQLTGRSVYRQQQEDLAILRAEFEAGNLEALEFEMRKAKIFGPGNEIEAGMERQIELSQQLGVQLSSSLGDLITSGGKASDVFKALGQDLAKMVLQLAVLNPLAKELQAVFSGMGGGGGGGSSSGSFWSGLLGIGSSLVGSLGGSNFGTGGANLNGSWGYTDPSAFAGIGAAGVTVNNFIDGAVDRARISTYVEQGVKAGIAASVDNTARGGSGVIG